MKKISLKMYVLLVVIVLGVANLIALSLGTPIEAMSTFSLGFLFGMFAMYIAIHVYKSDLTVPK